MLIETTDHGPGFPEGFLEHAFQRFRRFDPGRQRPGGGSGLGLSVVRAVARAHGGDANAANGPAGGAVVSFWIPLSKANNDGV
jgi:hypothetical protein